MRNRQQDSAGRGPAPAAGAPPSQGGRRPHSRWVLALVALVGLGLFTGFVALGNWQIERRAWKLDLIERVEQRAHAAPVAPPARARWAAVGADSDEYRRVRVAGVFDHARETYTQATTELGAGFWVLTPLRQADGSTVLVNRGFVLPNRREQATRADNLPEGEVTVTGLLRISEPGGGFLRSNAPQEDRWHSRDVAAIAAARGLSDVAPYFIDAEAATPRQPGVVAEPQTWPVPGLTVVSFKNSHMVYALTWYGLALMVVIAAAFVVREERRRRTR
ncbi:SURF1 family protein [Verticiella sediminum]|uniref:SURF1-like protein n=2 Tax=Verticiella sediminum TaxID=1247510 RepID=A0A556AS17_9BURK|nr:SURF1 family protein [Verticiella sediminum]TSH95729.1 SURF1 family protein [Verticiella sediminum]